MGLKAQEIIQWRQLSQFTLSAVHILGCDNVEVDHLSRSRETIPWSALDITQCLEHSTEWSLDTRITTHLFDVWGSPTVDLFTRLSHMVEVFYSRLPDSIALPGNPLQVD